MKKIIKGFIIFLLSFIIIESIAWIAAIKYIYKQCHVCPHIKIISPISPLRFRNIMTSFDDYYVNNLRQKLRKPSGLEYSGHPIVLFGCSFTYGDGLTDKQTISYKLANYMKRPVYNRGISGWGVQHMLWQLQNEPYLDTIKNPEYVIYTYIDDHLHRMFRYVHIPSVLFGPLDKNGLIEYMQYKERNGKLVRTFYIPFSRNIMTFNIISLWIQGNWWERFFNDKPFQKWLLNLFKMHLMESKKLINKKWPNAKIIIIDYENIVESVPRNSPLPNFWKKMQKEGFIYINSRKEFNVGSGDLQYVLSSSDSHPNEHAWDVIVPQLAKKLDEISSKK